MAHITEVLQCSVFIISSNEKAEGCCEGNGTSEARKEAGVRQNEATNPYNRLADFRYNISSYMHLCLFQDPTHVNAIRVKFK